VEPRPPMDSTWETNAYPGVPEAVRNVLKDLRGCIGAFLLSDLGKIDGVSDLREAQSDDETQ
jgi:hypothetical protein